MIEGLYDVAISCDISPSFFWHYSLGEIRSLINKYNKRKLDNYKQQVILANLQATRTIEFLMPCLSKEADDPRDLYDIFPGLFEEEKKAIDDQEFKLYKARMKEFAIAHNERLNRKEGE